MPNISAPRQQVGYRAEADRAKSEGRIRRSAEQRPRHHQHRHANARAQRPANHFARQR